MSGSRAALSTLSASIVTVGMVAWAVGSPHLWLAIPIAALFSAGTFVGAARAERRIRRDRDVVGWWPS